MLVADERPLFCYPPTQAHTQTHARKYHKKDPLLTGKSQTRANIQNMMDYFHLSGPSKMKNVYD